MKSAIVQSRTLPNDLELAEEIAFVLQSPPAPASKVRLDDQEKSGLRDMTSLTEFIR